MKSNMETLILFAIYYYIMNAKVKYQMSFALLHLKKQNYMTITQV